MAIGRRAARRGARPAGSPVGHAQNSFIDRTGRAAGGWTPPALAARRVTRHDDIYPGQPRYASTARSAALSAALGAGSGPARRLSAGQWRGALALALCTAGMHRIQRLASHIPLSPLTSPAASTTTRTGDSLRPPASNPRSTEMVVEGQTVVTASLNGLAPTVQETRRLVGALLDGPGFFIAKGVVPVRATSAPAKCLHQLSYCVQRTHVLLTTVDTCAVGGYGAARTCRALPSSRTRTG